MELATSLQMSFSLSYDVIYYLQIIAYPKTIMQLKH
jgi:hypothetical protein